MNDLEIEKRLVSQSGQEFFKPGLKRIKTFLQDKVISIHQYAPQIITIAGTNGKGESAYSLAELFKKDGKKYALWTSPHINFLRERFESHDGQIDQTLFSDFFLLVQRDAKKSGVILSYYEFLFAQFIYWVEQTRPDYLILEVGLGGRLDAVNILEADFVLLTSISRDHQEFLGKYYRSILFEKLGVLREKSHLLSTLHLNYLQEKVARLRPFKWDNFIFSQDDFSYSNRMLAVKAFQIITSSKLTAEQLYQSLSPSYIARSQKILLGEKEFVFYGAHNIDGMRKLIHFLKSKAYNNKESQEFTQVWVSFSKRELKEIEQMLKILFNWVGDKEKIKLIPFKHPKAIDFQLIHGQGWDELYTTKNDLTQALNSDEVSSKILVCGSYYFIGHVQSYLQAYPECKSC